MKNLKHLFLLTILLTTMSDLCIPGWITNVLNSFNNTPKKEITFNEQESINYINQSISSLSWALQSYMRDIELNNLKKVIYTNVAAAKYAHQQTSFFLSLGKRYKKDIIDQFIGSAVLEYIENTSYNYAYSRTKNQTISRYIAESMRNNAHAIIIQNSIINYERLTPFVGYALERAVNDQIIQNSYSSSPSYAPSAPSNNDKKYDSTDCCICLEDFGGNVTRIYLKPCGHDICRNCVFDYFFGANQHTTCPHCRATVNLSALERDIL